MGFLSEESYQKVNAKQELRPEVSVNVYEIRVNDFKE
jgi:hypothetical protein